MFWTDIADIERKCKASLALRQKAVSSRVDRLKSLTPSAVEILRACPGSLRQCTPLRSGQCVICREEHGDKVLHNFDIYNCNGFTLCGDHRYELRHGHEPRHEIHPGRGSPSNTTHDDDAFAHTPVAHSLGKVRHVYVRSIQEFRAYISIDQDG